MNIKKQFRWLSRFHFRLFFVAAIALKSVLVAKPNVVFLISDDQGYGDLSCHGNPVLKTPHLDALYAKSLRLTDYHVSPTCTPTRGALMSGHWSNRAGVWHTIMGRSMLYSSEKTLGEIFRENGYATGLFGKWHLGDNYPYRPEDRGFDEVVRHGGGGIGQTPDFWDNAYFDDTYFHNGKPKPYKGYCTDVFFAEAKRFIRQSVRGGKPFFVYLSTNTPHGPNHCPDAYWKPYAAKEGLEQREASFFGMIANLDENTGMLRAWLEEEGLTENTLFIFTTDNGTARGMRVFNAGMKGRKNDPYDGGHRVPFFIHWPEGGLFEGRDMDRICAHVDVLPTLIDLCGLNKLKDYPLDGRSLVPLIRDPEAPWPDRVIVTDSQRVRDPVKWRRSSVMTERWRLINGVELYDMKADPGQTKDVARQHSEIVRRLRTAYDEWWTDISPAFKKISRIVVGNPAENPSILTCHDWLLESESGNPPFQQAMIRKASARQTGEWAIRVERAGRYRIGLRRWPPESETPLLAALPPREGVQGSSSAHRMTPGVALDIRSAVLGIDDRSWTCDVTDTFQSSVDFEIDLPAGDVRLSGCFLLADGSEIGAYYAVVEKRR